MSTDSFVSSFVQPGTLGVFAARVIVGETRSLSPGPEAFTNRTALGCLGALPCLIFSSSADSDAAAWRPISTSRAVPRCSRLHRHSSPCAKPLPTRRTCFSPPRALSFKSPVRGGISPVEAHAEPHDDRPSQEQLSLRAAPTDATRDPEAHPCSRYALRTVALAFEPILLHSADDLLEDLTLRPAGLGDSSRTTTTSCG